MIKEYSPNFLQSAQWAKVNQLCGHQVITEKFGKKTNFLIVKSARRGRYLEIPGGPLLNWADQSAVSKAFSRIRELAVEHKCAFVRFRPQLLDVPENRTLVASTGAKPAPMHLHAEHTVMIDLTQSEDALLANMRRQTRYEVRRATKLGITVDKENSEELFQEFHAIQAETARRQHFIPPSLATLLAERTAFGGDAQIYVAQTSQGPIAYGLILKDSTEAAYFEAASTELNRKLPGAYALQWQVIKDLKRQKVKRYNLWGIAPPGVQNHRYSGVTTFKTGFGGEVVEFIPAQDIIINKLKYSVDLAIEKVRKKRRNL